MIIDIHCHIADETLRTPKIPERYSRLPSLNVEHLLAHMNESKINKTVLLGLDSGIGLNWFKGCKEYNNFIASLFNAYPDRFIGFLGVDLRRGKEAINELERCVDLGFKGVKLWPLTGFYVDNPSFYPFYEKVREYDIPILCHIGAGPEGTYIKYNRPANIHTVAVDFPEITFILPHIGEPWRDEAIYVAQNNPNTYLDVSAWAIYSYNRPMYFIETIVKAKHLCGLDKILFGSDWPLFLDKMSLKDWVETVKNMQTTEILQQLGYPEITEKEKEMILGKTASKILKL
jgi:predicted TIM-barrel fold metal-dependent hydrolase